MQQNHFSARRYRTRIPSSSSRATPIANVDMLGDEATRQILPEVGLATESDFATEFLARNFP